MRRIFPVALFCSAAVFGVSNTNAETIKFSGNVSASCTISNISDGGIVLQVPDTLTSTSNGGVTATFDVTNNSPNTFKVVIDDFDSFDTAPANTPTQIAFTTSSRISSGVNRDLDNSTIVTGAEEYELVNEGEDTFSIDLTAFAQASGASFPTGSYVATTTVTCSSI